MPDKGMGALRVAGDGRRERSAGEAGRAFASYGCADAQVGCRCAELAGEHERVPDVTEVGEAPVAVVVEEVHVRTALLRTA
jgi:hypothetical protein